MKTRTRQARKAPAQTNGRVRIVAVGLATALILGGGATAAFATDDCGSSSYCGTGGGYSSGSYDCGSSSYCGTGGGYSSGSYCGTGSSYCGTGGSYSGGYSGGGYSGGGGGWGTAANIIGGIGMGLKLLGGLSSISGGGMVSGGSTGVVSGGSTGMISGGGIISGGGVYKRRVITTGCLNGSTTIGCIPVGSTTVLPGSSIYTGTTTVTPAPVVTQPGTNTIVLPAPQVVVQKPTTVVVTPGKTTVVRTPSKGQLPYTGVGDVKTPMLLGLFGMAVGFIVLVMSRRRRQAELF